MGYHWVTLTNEGRFYHSISNLQSNALPFLIIPEITNKIENDLKNAQPLLLSSLLTNNGFKKDCENGIFYNEVAKEMGVTRDYFKGLSYSNLFFSKKNLNENTKIGMALNKLYPNLLKEINNKRDEVNQKLWSVLQHLESEIFIQSTKSLNINYITRHDSIIIDEKNKELVINHLISELKKIGINGVNSLKISELSLINLI